MQRNNRQASSSRRVLPGVLTRLKTPTGLSREAKHRLAWMDYLRAHSASLTCRHFGISRSLLYKWKSRYDHQGIRGLEAHTTRPRTLRTPTTPPAHIDLIRTLRKQNPELSKYKLQVILARDHDVHLSASTIGRTLTRYNLFFTSPVRPKGHPLRRAARRRKPDTLKGLTPGELVEVDLKHLPSVGTKRYAFVAIDRASRKASVHVATTSSSRQAAVAWAKAVARFGFPVQAVLVDNGSENLGAFSELLASQAIPQYFARPRTPKDKPYVERFIGSLERECIQWGGVAADLSDQQQVIDAWLDKYHNYRPHQALGYLTPAAYGEKLRGEVSTM